MWIRSLAVGIYLLVFLVEKSDGSCTFPSEITGEWYSSHKGLLTFNSTTITNYPMAMSVLVTSLDFTCYINSGYKYLLRATETALVFGSDIRAYVCIELYRVSEYKYIYYHGTTVSTTNNENVYGRVDSVTVTMDDACSRTTPYETYTYIVLVKSGAPESGLGAASCAPDFLAKYSSVVITDSSGATSCSGTTVDGCSDRTMQNYTYASCVSGMFSSGGLYICMHSLVSGSYTYLSVYNNDSSVDGSSTYRFTCFVISSTGSGVYATEAPNYCSDTTQTSTTVASPGLKYTFTSSTESCLYLVEGGSSIAYIIIIIVGSLTIIGVVILVVFLVKKKGCPCTCPCKKSSSSPIPGLEEEGEGFLSKLLFCKKCCKKTDPNLTARASINGLPPLDSLMAGKRGIRVGPVVEANMIQPLPKVEPLYGLRQQHSSKRPPSRMSIGSTFSFKFTR